MHPSSTPRKHKKPLGFLIFPGGGEKVHWEQMDYDELNSTMMKLTFWLMMKFFIICILM